MGIRLLHAVVCVTLVFSVSNGLLVKKPQQRQEDLAVTEAMMKATESESPTTTEKVIVGPSGGTTEASNKGTSSSSMSQTTTKSPGGKFSGSIKFPPAVFEALYKPGGGRNGTKITIELVPWGKVLSQKFPNWELLQRVFNRDPSARPMFFSKFRPHRNQTAGY